MPCSAAAYAQWRSHFSAQASTNFFLVKPTPTQDQDDERPPQYLGVGLSCNYRRGTRSLVVAPVNRVVFIYFDGVAMLPFQDGGRDFRVGATVAVRRSLAMKNETAPKKATVETCLTGYVFV